LTVGALKNYKKIEYAELKPICPNYKCKLKQSICIEMKKERIDSSFKVIKNQKLE